MLTPGLAEEKQKVLPMAGSNATVYGKNIDPIEQFNLNAQSADGSFLTKILAKERELAKLRIRKSGENIRSVIELGDIHFLNGKYTRARDVYTNALKLDSENSSVYKKLIDCYIALNNFDKVSEYYERLIAINPSPDFRHEYILFRLATNIGNAEELKAVEKDIRQLVSENGSDTNILNTYGVVLGFVLGKHEESKKYFEKAITADSANFHALNNLGAYFKFKNQPGEAIEKFKQAIELNSKYGAGYENIASVYIDQKNYTSALEILEAAVSDNAKLSDVWVHKIGWLLIQLEDFKKAIIWHKKKIKEEPENEFLLNNLGVCYVKRGDSDKAKECFTKAIGCFEANLVKPNFVADTRSINPYGNLMGLADATGDNDLVDSTAKRLLAIDPKNAMALYFRGVAQQKYKHYDFAKKCYLESIELLPSIVDPYINLAFIYETIDADYKSAINLLERAPFTEVDSPFFVNNLAYAYIKNGDISKAKSLLSKTKMKGNPSLDATKGLLELYEDNFKKAEAYYKKAIDNISYNQKDFAQQVWLYEQAYYWVKNENYTEANQSLDKALEMGDVGYAYSFSKDLKKKIEHKV